MTLSSFTAQYIVQLIPPEHSNKTNKLVQMSIFNNISSSVQSHFQTFLMRISSVISFMNCKQAVCWVEHFPTKRHTSQCPFCSILIYQLKYSLILMQWAWWTHRTPIFFLNLLLSCWIFFKTTYIKLKSSVVQSTHIWNQWLNVPTDVFPKCFFHHLACWSLAYSHSLCLMIGATQRW